jgi:hypothetical protein
MPFFDAVTILLMCIVIALQIEHCTHMSYMKQKQKSIEFAHRILQVIEIKVK